MQESILYTAYKLVRKFQGKMEYKMVILVRQDLKLQKGKMSAQVAHAAVESTLKSEKNDPDTVRKWRDSGQKKVVLKVADEKELFQYKEDAKAAGLVTALITDAGKTHIAPGTTTCMAIGPDLENKIDKVTGSLSML